jgi:hypothetical protein
LTKAPIPPYSRLRSKKNFWNSSVVKYEECRSSAWAIPFAASVTKVLLVDLGAVDVRRLGLVDDLPQHGELVTGALVGLDRALGDLAELALVLAEQPSSIR